MSKIPGESTRIRLTGLAPLKTTIIFSLLLLAGCASEPPTADTPTMSPEKAQALITRLLPTYVTDRSGWSADIYAGFATQTLDPNRDSICAVIAVTEQESGFRVNPVVPGLPDIAWREIDRRASASGVPLMLVHGALRLPSTSGPSFGARIDKVKTEKDLSDIFEDMIAAVPMGRRLFADRNPIRTRGPMQVNVAFAKEFAATHPYPYPLAESLPDDLFSRRGSVYFGIAHLFAYTPHYPDYIYRFADYNAGQFASRNAAFQHALQQASGVPLIYDGALLPHDDKAPGAGSTERAARLMGSRLRLSEADIHEALDQAGTREFETTRLYQGVFELADRGARRTLARAMVPRITLHGAKLHRTTLTTDWYANRVDSRFKQCLSR